MGDLTIDYAERRVTLAGRPVPLTDLERRLLFELSVNAGRMLDHKYLLQRVWGTGHAGHSGPVRTVIKNLRRKLGDSPDDPTYIFNTPRVGEGTIVDASIIEAPSSTKNRRRARDPEMHQTKKGNEWHFGMKLHIGVDADSGLVHSMRATAANVADVTEAHRLLHGEEREAYGDAGYQGVEKRPEQAEVAWRVAMRPGLRRLLEPGSAAARAEREKASLRAQVEHPFLAVKRRFGYDKARYRGLAKNDQRLALLLGLTNLLRAEPQLA